MPTHYRGLAHAKLTLRLTVVGRRPDGYHLLSAEMVAVDLADELVIEREPASSSEASSSEASSVEVVDAINWTLPAGGQAASSSSASSPAGVPGIEPVATRPASTVPEGGTNLVVRALQLAGVGAKVRLTKRIPAGGGLGGGSADAAAVLRWAGFTDLEKAAGLGADVPFCLVGGRASVGGIGERLETLEDLRATYLLCSPPFPVATAEVYRAYDELASGVGPASRSGGNDLEAAAVAVEPRLASWRALLAEASGRTPLLAGSGATWFVEVPDVEAEEARVRCVEAVRRSGHAALVALARTVPKIADPVPS